MVSNEAEERTIDSPREEKGLCERPGHRVREKKDMDLVVVSGVKSKQDGLCLVRATQRGRSANAVT